MKMLRLRAQRLGFLMNSLVFIGAFRSRSAHISPLLERWLRRNKSIRYRSVSCQVSGDRLGKSRPTGRGPGQSCWPARPRVPQQAQLVPFSRMRGHPDERHVAETVAAASRDTGGARRRGPDQTPGWLRPPGRCWAGLRVVRKGRGGLHTVPLPGGAIPVPSCPGPRTWGTRICGNTSRLFFPRRRATVTGAGAVVQYARTTSQSACTRRLSYAATPRAGGGSSCGALILGAAPGRRVKGGRSL